MTGSDYCSWHDKSHKRVKPFELPPIVDDLGPPKDVDELFRVLADTIYRVRKGELNTAQAAAIAACSREALKCKPDKKGVADMDEVELLRLAGDA